MPKTFIRVICPSSGNIRNIPVYAEFGVRLVTNTCDFSNGTEACNYCLPTIQKILNEDCDAIRKSFELPLSLY